MRAEADTRSCGTRYRGDRKPSKRRQDIVRPDLYRLGVDRDGPQRTAALGFGITLTRRSLDIRRWNYPRSDGLAKAKHGCSRGTNTVRKVTYADRAYWASFPGEETLGYFAAAFFSLTLLTDWAYIQTTVLMWKDFSAWLLFAGLVAGGFAVVLWLIGLAVHRTRPLWAVVLLNALVLLAAFINSLVHAGDGWTGIVPWGIGLSVLTCLLMLASATLRRMAARPMRRV
jgi:uncharacterized membrane protein